VRLGRARRLALLSCLVAAAAGAGIVSVRRVNDQLAVIEACEAVDQERWAVALAKTAGRVADSETGHAALSCRCLALLATGGGDECIGLLERAVEADEGGEWTPGPELSVHLIQTWREQGRSADAARLAQRAARRYPDDPTLFYLEIETRSAVEDEATVLLELEARLPPAGPQAARMRVSLANRHLLRGDAERALAVLGDRVPAGAGAAAELWFDTRGMALATSGDVAAVDAHYDAWRRAGGDPAELEGRYALTLSIAGLNPPGGATIDLLVEAYSKSDRWSDAKLREAVAIRLILALANAARTDEALAVYDHARREFELAGLSRDEIERSAAQRSLAELPPAQRRGTLRFLVPDPAAGTEILLSPDVDEPVDSEFTALPLPASGRVEVVRGVGAAPQRWVVRDAQERTLASGTINPVAGRVVDVRVAPRAPEAPARMQLARKSADGRRRVILLLLDCADWRITGYLRARGDLPTLDALLRSGHRAVLDSDPPLTAAALEAIVWPHRRGDASLLGIVHRVGTELAGLASVGENPFAALAWLLPEDEDLFARLGAGRHAVANLLLSHGGIRAGRHSEITGPDGLKRRVPLHQSARDLNPDERERYPLLARALLGRDAIHVRTIAAEFDTTREIVEAGEVDLLALRVEPLDILTHAHFAEAVRNGQDDGRNLLYAIYRYIDARIAEVYRETDADDVFIVMSDHGIRTAMEHSRHAMFIATGPGVPVGRAPGRPAIRGVGAVAADLLGVATDWPDTGIAPWARTLASTSDDSRATAR